MRRSRPWGVFHERNNGSGILEVHHGPGSDNVLTEYFEVNRETVPPELSYYFERMKHNPQAVTTAMQLYFSGESLRNAAISLRLLGVQVSHKTVYNWIKKYTALMEKYLDKIAPQVSDTWATDELLLKVKGNMKYLYAMMDEQTRFWIAQQVANTKFAHCSEKPKQGIARRLRRLFRMVQLTFTKRI